MKWSDLSPGDVLTLEVTLDADLRNVCAFLVVALRAGATSRLDVQVLDLCVGRLVTFDRYSLDPVFCGYEVQRGGEVIRKAGLR